MPAGHSATGDRPQPAPGDAHVARGESVVEREGHLALLLVPLARPAVQVSGARGLAAALLGAQHLAEQRVVAVRGVRRIERCERDSRPREVAQHLARSGRAQHGVAHRPRQDPRTDVRMRNSTSAAGSRATTSSRR